MALNLLGIVLLGVALTSVGGEARSRSRMKLGGGGRSRRWEEMRACGPGQSCVGGSGARVVLSFSAGEGVAFVSFDSTVVIKSSLSARVKIHVRWLRLHERMIK